MNDDEIDSLIRRTHPTPEFPTSFQREVWAKIAVAEQSWSARWKQASEMLLLWLARPLPAVAAVALMLIAGISLGSFAAQDQSQAMKTAYLSSISPLKAAHGIMQP